MLFASNGCPHCRSFARSWAAVERACEGTDVHCTRVDVDDPESAALRRKHRVSEIPTLILRLPGHKNAERYRGDDMTKKGVMKWLQIRGAL